MSKIDYTNPVSIDDEGVDLWEVEKIISKKVKAKKVFYLIKWAGWEDKHNTWEPTENLLNIKHLIREYEKNLKNEENNEKVLYNKKLACFLFLNIIKFFGLIFILFFEGHFLFSNRALYGLSKSLEFDWYEGFFICSKN